VLLAVLLVSATACGSASATKPCWQQVQDDWTANKLGEKTYPAKCYDQAIKHLGRDLLIYSAAPADIRAAKQEAIKKKENLRTIQGVGGGGSSDGGSNSGGGSSDGGTNSTAGPLSDVMNAGSSSADGMPLPLMILGGVAALLVALGAFGVVSRRLHERGDQ
jgi:hypothetical protein